MTTQRVFDEDSGETWEIDVDRTVWAIGSGEIVDPVTITVAATVICGSEVTGPEFAESCRIFVREGLFDADGRTIKGILLAEDFALPG